MKHWITTKCGNKLCNETAKRWNTKNLTNDEMTIIMDQIKRMVPPSALENYITDVGDWDKEALLSMEFMTFIYKIKRHEDTHVSDWYHFNNKLGYANENSVEQKINTVETVKTPAQNHVVGSEAKELWKNNNHQDSLLRPQDFNQNFRGRSKKRGNADNYRGSGRLPGRGRGQYAQQDQQYQANYQQRPQQQQNQQYQQVQQYQQQQTYQNRQIQQNQQPQPKVQSNGFTNEYNNNRARGRNNANNNDNRGRNRRGPRIRGGRGRANNTERRVYAIEGVTDNSQQLPQQNPHNSYQQQGQPLQYQNLALPTPLQHTQPVPQYYNPQPQRAQVYQAPAVPQNYASTKNGSTPAPNTRSQGVGVVQQIYGHGH